MGLDRCFNIEDLRREAKRRLPRGLFEFIDRATEDDVAMRRNREGFERLRLAPKMMVDVSRRSAEVELFGKTHSMPVAVSPAGPAGFFWHKGELAIARAAAAAQVPFTLSTYSTTEMEEVIATGVEAWFQFYQWVDRDLSYSVLDRARSVGFKALVVTVDTAMLGQREYLERNGFKPPFKASSRALGDMLLHPRWLFSVPVRYLIERAWPHVATIPVASPQTGSAQEIERRSTLTQSLTWDDLARLREKWAGTLMVKGILRPADAKRAVGLGCDAVIVSNHGGRNLDAIVSPIDVLPKIVAVVGNAATVMMDGGIRRGSDIVRARALGAAAVLVGRPILYGVSAAGEAGARHALELLRSELDRTMALTGCPTIADIGPDLIDTGLDSYE